MGWLCRDCLANGPAPDDAAKRCPDCGGPRLRRHAELHALSVAHLDCDAFYANVEKRDNPALRDQPVLVGGAKRGVVMAACYIARTYGIRSAMPMFKALKACPHAVVVRPEMAKYGAIGRQIRALMGELTPLVEPLSIDEAFLDLGGTERLHGGSPARSLAGLALRIEREFGLTVSIGLSHNKFLAKLASDLDKPRGFAVIGRAEAADFLRSLPVEAIWGVGQVLRRKLVADGLRSIGDLQARPEADLVARYGAMGSRLARCARGEDARPVTPSARAKSLSVETTLERDIADAASLQQVLWRLCEKLSRRLKEADKAGHGVVLKLKTADFRLRTRSRRLAHPTQLAEVLYQTGKAALLAELDGTRFRLVGIGVADVVGDADADPEDWLDPRAGRDARVERAIDAVRAKLGDEAIIKGRALKEQSGPARRR
jgi:DNA polymerase-4